MPLTLKLYVPITAVIGGRHITVMVPSAEIEAANQVEAFVSRGLTNEIVYEIEPQESGVTIHLKPYEPVPN